MTLGESQAGRKENLLLNWKEDDSKKPRRHALIPCLLKELENKKSVT